MEVGSTVIAVWVVPDSVYIAEAEHTFSISQALAQDLVKHEVKPKDLFWHSAWPRIGNGKERAKWGWGTREREMGRRGIRGGCSRRWLWGSFMKGKREGNMRGAKSGMGTGTTNWSRFQDLYVH
jgi:hypothetical protein